MKTPDDQKDSYNSVTLPVLLWMITKEGLLAAAFSATLGLVYALLFSEEPLLRMITNAIFLMGVVLGFYALFFGVSRDKKMVRNMFRNDFKDQYMEKISQRKERILHLYRAFVVFVVAVVLDLALFFL